MPAVSQQVVRLPKPKYMLYGQVVKIYPEDGAVALFHQEIPGFMNAMPGPQAMEFLTLDRQALAKLKPGMRISAAVRKRGSDYMLEQIRITPEQRKSK
jgi:Cu/Ag efflux protein CusF